MEAFVGKTLGNYQVVELIGRGGMATVYKGYQSSMNRMVAIKVLAPQYSGDEPFVRRFKHEAHTIAQLEHTHILPVYDFGEQDGTLFIVMRYLEGGTLEDLIRPGGMELTEVYHLFGQVASALQYAHTRGVVHRDVKPSNLLIDSQGDAFLMDFGIAKLVESTEKLTGTGGVVGSPTYMAPEQCTSREVDARTDIYALGVLLFEMITGKPPFEADNAMALMLKHVNDPAPRPSEFVPGLHQAVDAVILRAMAKDPVARYQSVGEMAEEFRKAVIAATGVASDTLAVLDMPGRPVAPSPPPVDRTIPSMPTPPPMAAAPVAPITTKPNPLTRWLEATGATLAVWLQGMLLSFVTFLLLARLTEGGLVVAALLSLVPGILLYALLRAPTLGALTSFALVFVPLMARAPGVALIWAVITIIAAARLHSHEMLLTLVTVTAAGSPLGWTIPLLAPWWFKARKTVLPMALGSGLAILAATTLGWSDAGNLLPGLALDDVSQVVLGPRPDSYLALFEPAAWPTPSEMAQAIPTTLNGLSTGLLTERGHPLIVMISWSLAAILSVSNRRASSSYLRPLGLPLALIALLLPVYQSASLPALILGTLSIIPAFLLSQWPVQADPNRGNYPSTILRLLRQALGAFFVAVGIAFYVGGTLDKSPLHAIFSFGVVAGAITMVVNPLIGCLLTFAALLAGLMPVSLSDGIIVLVLFAIYLVVSIFFDRRRPRGWNPLGMGALIGGPGLALSGLMPILPLSLGALETQVPAAIFAVAAYITLWVGSGRPWGGAAILAQIIMALVGVLLVERLMDIGLLRSLGGRVRRLLFTLGSATLITIVLYALGGLNDLSLPVMFVVNLVASAALVGALGERASDWQRFIEPEPEEKEVTSA